MYNPIMNIISEERLRWQEPLSLHTSFKVGGPADVMVFPSPLLKFSNWSGFADRRESHL